MSKLEILKETIELNKHLHEMSNLKSGVILVVAGLLFSGITGVPDDVKEQAIYEWGFLIMLISLMISVVLIIASVYPRFGKRNFNNLLYFVDIVEKLKQEKESDKSNEDKYLELLTKVEDGGKVEKMYSLEAVAFSETLVNEYKWQKAAFRALLFFIPGIICIAIAFLLA